MPPETALPAESPAPPVALLTLSSDLPARLSDAWRRALAPTGTDPVPGHPVIALCDSPYHALARALARHGDVAAALSSWTDWAAQTTARMAQPDAPTLVDIRALHGAGAAALLARLGRPAPTTTDTLPDPDDVLLSLAQTLIDADPDRAALARTIYAAFAVAADPADPAATALAAHIHLRSSLDKATTDAAVQALALERALRGSIAAQQAESQLPARIKNWQDRLAESRATNDRLQARIAELEQARTPTSPDQSALAADRARLLARIAEMETSTSWRVTGPLRRLSRLFRRR